MKLDFIYLPSKDVASDLRYFPTCSARRFGWRSAGRFEIPHGPCCSFIAPGGQRIALYQLTRPQAAASFEGRRDF